MTKLFTSWNLKTRILVLVAGLVLAGVWIFALRMSAILQAEIEKLVSDQLTSQAKYVADELDDELQFRVDLLYEIAAPITLGIGADPEKVQNFFDQRTPFNRVYPLGIMMVNKDGAVIADRPPIRMARRSPHRDSLAADREYFRDVMARTTPSIGPPLRSPRISAEPLIPVAVPLRNAQGELLGALFAPVLSSDRDLFGKLVGSRIGETGHYLVMSPKDGLIVLATQKELNMTRLPPKGQNPILDRRLYEGFEGAAITVNPAGVEVLGASHVLRSTGWVLVANITTEEAFAPIHAYKNRIYYTALLVSLVVAAIVFMVLRHQLAPLDDAGKSMQRMIEGNEPLAPLPVKREDEFGRLLTIFNRLVAKIMKTEDDIRSLNLHLENRVQERTNELLAANRMLETEMQERKRAEASASDYASRLRLMTRRIVDVQEDEQRRLARELHDQVSSNLTAVSLGLDLIEKQLSGEIRARIGERLSDCVALLKDTTASARDITSELHPAVLDYMGLVPALEDLGEKFEKRTNIAVAVTGTNDGRRLPLETQMALFRIAQEALVNCAKHSQANSVAIQLNCDSEHVQLSITDDGLGFDTVEMSRRGKSTGLGLLSMQERAEAIGGKCHFESTPGNETRVIVELGL